MCFSVYCALLQGLKSHAVTMFEVGKLSDESLDSFLAELEKVFALKIITVIDIPCILELLRVLIY